MYLNDISERPEGCEVRTYDALVKEVETESHFHMLTGEFSLTLNASSPADRPCSGATMLKIDASCPAAIL